MGLDSRLNNIEQKVKDCLTKTETINPHCQFDSMQIEKAEGIIDGFKNIKSDVPIWTGEKLLITETNPPVGDKYWYIKSDYPAWIGGMSSDVPYMPFHLYYWDGTWKRQVDSNQYLFLYPGTPYQIMISYSCTKAWVYLISMMGVNDPTGHIHFSKA